MDLDYWEARPCIGASRPGVRTMAPRKNGSVRYKSRPTTLIAPFRDDTSLVALRYEQTKQAELPVPIVPARNSLRTRRSHSGPVVVVPPNRRPREQHPLFRDQSDERKRDSGLAHTSPSTTVRESGEDMSRDERVDNHVEACFRGKEQAGQATQGTVCTPRTPPRALGLFTIPLSLRPASSTEQFSSPDTPTRSPPSSLRHRRRLAKTTSATSTGDRSKRLRLRQRSLSNTVHGDWLPSIPPMPILPSSHESLKPSGSRSSFKSVKSSSKGPSRQSRRSASLAGEKADDSNLVPSLPPITTQVAADGFFDDFDSTLTFSKRGSIMFGGRRAIDKGADLAASPTARGEGETDPTVATLSTAPTPEPSAGPAITSRASVSEPSQVDGPSASRPSSSGPSVSPMEKSPEPPPTAPRIHVISIDVQRESRKVRSLYDSGVGLNWQDGERVVERLTPTKEVVSDEEEDDVYGFV